MPPTRLEVGRVVKPHGIRGEVAVEVYSDAPRRFAPGSVIGAGATEDPTFRLTVEAARAHQGRLLVTFREISDRDAAERIRGAVLSIPVADAGALGEWSFYPFQLEGLEVVDTGGAVLGRMLRVEENPANDLWVVAAGAREVLVPAVREIVRAVDLEAGRIVLDPPEGLFGR